VTSFERLASEEGIAKGIQQGMQQGRLAGEAHLLARLLTRRFGEVPPWVLSRLQAASEAELEAWAEAVLSAASIEAVFSAARH
jgi:flagellar biosynthesis/type III secretory pathway protein FliH